MTSGLLTAALEAVIPAWVGRVAALTPAQRAARAATLADYLAAHGDDILYQGRGTGDTARAFNSLAEAVAIGACQPGGITIFGRHWQSSPSRQWRAYYGGCPVETIDPAGDVL